MPALPLIALFGLLGVLCRYGLDQLFTQQNHSFPVTTFIINILGCAVAAFVFFFAEKGHFSVPLQTGLLVGFCGGFTTFSAYALQTYSMIEKGRVVPALLYLSISPILGVATIWCLLVILRKSY